MYRAFWGIIRVIFVSLALGGQTTLLRAGEDTFKVVSWNLEWFPGRAPKASQERKEAHIAAVQEALAELKPDILLLQEVRDEEAAKLAVEKLPDMKVAVFSKFYGDQQLAIVTHFPVNSGWSEEWKRKGENDPPRGYNFAAIELPGSGKPLLMTYTFHFKSNHGSETQMQANIAKREAASAQLGEHIQDLMPKYAGKGKLAWLLGGDFNTSLDDKRFESEQTMRSLLAGGLAWVFEGVPEKRRETLPAEGRYPATTFDHILYRGLELVSVKVPTDYPQASDHRPVVAEYRLPK